MDWNKTSQIIQCVAAILSIIVIFYPLLQADEQPISEPDTMAHEKVIIKPYAKISEHNKLYILDDKKALFVIEDKEAYDDTKILRTYLVEVEGDKIITIRQFSGTTAASR